MYSIHKWKYGQILVGGGGGGNIKCNDKDKFMPPIFDWQNVWLVVMHTFLL